MLYAHFLNDGVLRLARTHMSFRISDGLEIDFASVEFWFRIVYCIHPAWPGMTTTLRPWESGHASKQWEPIEFFIPNVVSRWVQGTQIRKKSPAKGRAIKFFWPRKNYFSTRFQFRLKLCSPIAVSVYRRFMGDSGKDHGTLHVLCVLYCTSREKGKELSEHLLMMMQAMGNFNRIRRWWCREENMTVLTEDSDICLLK
jgi:hypothetical protein